MSVITLAIPSKGRLMEATAELLAKAGFTIDRLGADRGYRGVLRGLEGVEIAFLSASEIAQNLRDGKVDLGVTGQDLLTEKIPPDDKAVQLLVRLGFGPADVVVAVPECWLDVATMADLDEIAESFYERHGRRLRVATKYHNLTRRFFAEKGVTGYRIVESLGATEGAPAAGIAEIIVDITTTGSTLAANALKILDDGVILRSCAVLAGRVGQLDDPRARRLVEVLSAIT
ncbi:ATP phosphoribosyltransferase [Aestuariivirga litoralis]|uniref:ATP phosphoribosyltransferase n=1 Tax=Aestuariivirga litoralis TaxID=2650924 RepID=A0A2W2C8V5_9HYPH|nr:ATP phosphoribosyltransferase [Aestuariivirga litoralis]PZF76633.1 ATP phosphoribosyltransferase [Aestuariivirga litoralis]